MKYMPAIVVAISVCVAVAIGFYVTKDARSAYGFGGLIVAFIVLVLAILPTPDLGE